jgi:hypothetical protein
MKTSQRDKVLMMFIPGLALMMCYVLYYFTSGHRTLVKLQSEAAKATQRQPSDAQLTSIMLKARDADEALANAKKEHDALQGKWRELTGWVQSGDPHDRLTRLLELLKRNQVHLVNHVPADAARDSGKTSVSPAVAKLAKQIADKGSQRPPQLWRMHLIGSYASILHSLQELSSGEALAVPVALSMKQPETLGSAREWYILVWI